jgi:hypothetical protein
MNRFFPIFLFLFIHCSCNWEPHKNDQSAAPPKKDDTVRRIEPVKKTFFRDSTVDFTARYIAGLPQAGTNNFSALQEKTYWKQHMKSSEENWKKLNDERLTLISNWERTVFRSWKNDSLPLFYPFSGPDFVHAAYLYPLTDKYIFAALEPITDLPDLEQLNDENRKIFLQSVENSLRDIYNKSYFITTHMASDFKFDKAKGVLPVFYVFLVRSGFEILDVESVAIDSAGQVHDTLIKGKSKWVSGVKFSFRNQGSDTLRELYYYNVDVSDNGLNKTPGFLTYLRNQGKVNTFVKSASYLMHYSSFTKMRNTVIEISQTIFQDDTGIPYKHMKSNKNFETVLFGEYTRPVKDFGDYVFQNDLDSLYKTNVVKNTLPFHLGYHWGDKKQSQQLFIRKQ